MPYSDVRHSLESQVFKAHRAVFCTLTALYNLYDRSFTADVVVIDEAS